MADPLIEVLAPGWDDDLPDMELPTFAPRPNSPMKARDLRPRLTVAGPPALIAEVEHAAARANVSTMEWCRQSWQASLDGYPAVLPDHVHAWIERQARILGCSWADAHAAVMGEVARRYPRGVRLDGR
jgi:hypothetical protein